MYLVYAFLKEQLPFCLDYRYCSYSHEGIVEELCKSTPRLKGFLIRFRDNTEKEFEGGNNARFCCKPCFNKVQPCIRSMKFMKQITDDEIGNICKYYNLVFSGSVGTFTKISDNLGSNEA